jgi:hypothetical protein
MRYAYRHTLSLFRAGACWLVLICLAVAMPSRGAESPPSWLSLVQPERGRVTLSGDVSWGSSEDTYPEIWTRSTSAHVRRRYAMGVWYPLTDGGAGSEWTQALIVNAATEDTVASSTIHSWGIPDPYVSTVTNSSSAPRLRIGWQLEQLTALWRRGVEVGYGAPTNTYPEFDIAVWLARAYEPAILTLCITQDLRQPPPAGLAPRLGVEVALNRRLLLSVDIAVRWPGVPSTGEATGGHFPDSWPRLDMAVAANLQQDDRSGWGVAIQLGPRSYGVSLERSLALPSK